MPIEIPKTLLEACRGSTDRQRWLGQLPSIAADLRRRWSLSIGSPFNGTNASCSWVAPAQRKNGSSAVLKISLPHMEARDEAPGLRFWAGDPTVRLLEHAEDHNALLLERCEPGTSLRQQPEPQQDMVIAALLKRLWRVPRPAGKFRHLSVMTTFWSSETTARADQWPDSAVVKDGLHLFAELSQPTARDVLLATDLHAGNVLSAQRMPWLVIDPKPFVGDPAYDATQHLLNCVPRLLAEPRKTIACFADLLEVDGERVRLWLFARAAAEPRDRWEAHSHELAKVLARKVAPA